MLARRSLGGYFFCSDSIATINVANETIKINASNTVILSPPFKKGGATTHESPITLMQL